MNSLKKGIIFVVIAVILFVVLSYLLFGYFQLGDDIFIYLQYAKHILNNGEVSFNLGDPTYGFTGPVWLGLILLLSIIFGFSINIPTILSFAFAVLTIIIWARILKKFNLIPSIYSLLLVIILVDPNLLKHTYLGMEATLSYFLSSLTIWLLLFEKSKCRIHFLGIIMGLYGLVRPESILLAIVFFIYFLTDRESLENISKYIFTGLMIVVPWLIFSLLYFEQLLPNTFYAKGAAYAIGSNFLKNIYDSAIIFSGSYLPIIILIGICFIFFGANKSFEKFNIFSLLIIAIYILFYSLTINHEFVYARYYSIVFPFISYLFINLITKINFLKQRSLIAILSLIIVVQFSFSVFYSVNAKKLYIASEHVEDEVIEWINDNTYKDQKIVRARIGKIGFKTDRIIVDPIGLINPEIINYYKKENISEYYGSVRPDYVITSELDHTIFKESKLVKRFVYPSNFLVRQLFFSSEQNKVDTLKINKIYW